MVKLKERAKKLKMDIPAIFIALGEKDTPVFAKIMAAITITYALSPIDLIPDFIPVLGYLDDLILLPVFVMWTIALIPEEIMVRCKKKSENLWKDGKPKKWYYGIPIFFIWVIFIIVVIKIYF